MGQNRWERSQRRCRPTGHCLTTRTTHVQVGEGRVDERVTDQGKGAQETESTSTETAQARNLSEFFAKMVSCTCYSDYIVHSISVSGVIFFCVWRPSQPKRRKQGGGIAVKVGICSVAHSNYKFHMSRATMHQERRRIGHGN